MAQIRPFAGIHYAKRSDLDFSKVIAPPYDVLDEGGKAALQARHPNNVVTIDLPHLPAKAAGPGDVYERAKLTLDAWRAARVLVQDPRPALYPYTQRFEQAGRTFHRRGFIALVRLTPFGADVVPHEKTYPGPIEDRLALMRATNAQLSPIFGLFSDPRNEITNALYHTLAKPDFSGLLDDVHNDLWHLTDAETTNQVTDAMKDRPVYIADGHHRYTTALKYKQEMEQRHGGALPPNHPANWCMFVLVSMQDPGLLILPTHRLVGGMSSFDPEAFRAVLGVDFEMIETAMGAEEIGAFVHRLAGDVPHSFGLFDGRGRRFYVLRLKNPEILASLEPDHSAAWRSLDVAILQRYLIDEVLQPKFAAGKELVRSYTADPQQIPAQVDGGKYQIALLLQPTPLHALEELAKQGEVMPQKSTYFFPKLATGMVINPL